MFSACISSQCSAYRRADVYKRQTYGSAVRSKYPRARVLSIDTSKAEALPGVVGSPCGTGTSARCALLIRQGKLRQGETFVNESFIGSLFSCRAVGETEIGGIPAIIPEVTGSAYLMGKSTFFLDPADPFPEGFQVK